MLYKKILGLRHGGVFCFVLFLFLSQLRDLEQVTAYLLGLKALLGLNLHKIEGLD